MIQAVQDIESFNRNIDKFPHLPVASKWHQGYSQYHRQMIADSNPPLIDFKRSSSLTSCLRFSLGLLLSNFFFSFERIQDGFVILGNSASVELEN